eukprot:scaffold3166_cov399-Prasinococcus_capsulatus_cf.AAC.31
MGVAYVGKGLVPQFYADISFHSKAIGRGRRQTRRYCSLPRASGRTYTWIAYLQDRPGPSASSQANVRGSVAAWASTVEHSSRKARGAVPASA